MHATSLARSWVRTASLGFVLAISLVASSACGGGDDPPGPLSKHYDEVHVAMIDMSQKQGMLQAQQAWTVARAEEAKAKADYDDMSTKLSAAQNDKKKADLELDTAKTNKKSADASADTNKINAAEHAQRTAELAVKAAEARINYYKAYRDYLKVHMRSAQENTYWREAQFELQKAQLGQKNNIAPKGVNYADFPNQEKKRAERAQKAKQKEQGSKTKATAARENWLKAQQTADQATGTPSSYPDPMQTAEPAPAPEPTPTTDTTDS